MGKTVLFGKCYYPWLCILVDCKVVLNEDLVLIKQKEGSVESLFVRS